MSSSHSSDRGIDGIIRKLDRTIVFARFSFALLLLPGNFQDEGMHNADFVLLLSLLNARVSLSSIKNTRFISRYNKR